MWENFFERDAIFWFCALAGSGLFLIQLLLSFLGSADAEDGGGFESAKFKWLSKQAITGFLMMFGWTALTCQREWGFSMGLTLVCACGAGIATVILTAFMFRGAKRLHSSGTVFSLDQAIGKEAIVYHQIPKQGRGTILLSIEGISREIDAVSLHGEEIGSFLRVHIVKKIDDTAVAVLPL